MANLYCKNFVCSLVSYSFYSPFPIYSYSISSILHPPSYLSSFFFSPSFLFPHSPCMPCNRTLLFVHHSILPLPSLHSGSIPLLSILTFIHLLFILFFSPSLLLFFRPPCFLSCLPFPVILNLYSFSIPPFSTATLFFLHFLI